MERRLVEKEKLVLKAIVEKKSNLNGRMKLDFNQNFASNCKEWKDDKFSAISDYRYYGAGFNYSAYGAVLRYLKAKGFITIHREKNTNYIYIDKENFKNIKEHFSELMDSQFPVDQKVKQQCPFCQSDIVEEEYKVENKNSKKKIEIPEPVEKIIKIEKKSRVRKAKQINKHVSLADDEKIVLSAIVKNPSVLNANKLDFSKSYMENCKNWKDNKFSSISSQSVYGSTVHGRRFSSVFSRLKDKNFITIIRDSRFQNIHMFQITEKNFNNIKRFLRELDIYTEKKNFKINTDNPLTEKEIILLRDIIGKPSTIYDGMKLDFSKSFEENCRDWGKSEFLTFSNKGLYGSGMHGNVYCGVCAILSKKGYISNPSDKKRTIAINKENFEKIKKHISEIVPEKVSVESKIEVENTNEPKEKPRGMWSKIKSFFGIGKE